MYLTSVGMQIVGARDCHFVKLLTCSLGATGVKQEAEDLPIIILALMSFLLQLSLLDYERQMHVILLLVEFFLLLAQRRKQG